MDIKFKHGYVCGMAHKALFRFVLFAMKTVDKII